MANRQLLRMGTLAFRRRWALRIAALLLLLPWPARGQAAAAHEEGFGYLGVRRERVPWPAPESLVSQLRSADERLRLNALRLLGLTEQEAHVSVWAQAPSERAAGEKVVAPDQVQLTYAALGDGPAQQAMIAVQDSADQMTYAAVGVPTPKGWERAAAFDCWCKYEMYSGEDALEEFATFQPAPQRFELVMQASGGGTGIYTQYEAHFRIFHGELRRVLGFVSESRKCPPPEECTLVKRWFFPAGVHGQAGGVLVESRGTFVWGSGDTVGEFVRALENRHLGPATCREYEWDEQNFQYAPAGAAEPCDHPHQ